MVPLADRRYLVLGSIPRKSGGRPVLIAAFIATHRTYDGEALAGRRGTWHGRVDGQTAACQCHPTVRLNRTVALTATLSAYG